MSALMGLPCDLVLLAAAYRDPLDARVTVEQVAQSVIDDWMEDTGYFAQEN